MDRNMKVVVAGILYLSYFLLLVFSEFEKFEGVSYLGGYTCPKENVVFEVNTTVGKIECLVRCKSDLNCSGVFYQEEVPTCIGCTCKNVNEFVPVTLNSVYYRRPVKGELKCSGKPCLMYQMIDVEQNWTQAKAHCTSLGGVLVQIHTEEIQESLVNFVLVDEVFCTWTGGSIREANGTFVWPDGTLVSHGYENWYPGEPTYFPGESCLEITRRDINFTWNDIVCDGLCGSVCEFK